MPFLYLYLDQPNKSFICRIMVTALKDVIDEYRKVDSLEAMVEVIKENPDMTILLDLPKSYTYESFEGLVDVNKLATQVKILNTTLLKQIETFRESPISLIERAIENALKRIACSNYLIDLDERTIYLDIKDWTFKEVLHFNRNIEHLLFRVNDMGKCINILKIKKHIADLQSTYSESEIKYIVQSLLGK